MCAPLVQLDRMSAYGADGRRFESCTGCFHFSVLLGVCLKAAGYLTSLPAHLHASLAQSVARRSHNSKVVSSILTRSIYLHVDTFLTALNRLYGILVANHMGSRQNCRNSSRAYWRSGLRSVASSSSWNLNARAATLSEVWVFYLGLQKLRSSRTY